MKIRIDADLKVDLHCYHCGADCNDQSIHEDEHIFCCEGCKLVYGLLKENDLCTYYNLEKSPGIKRDKKDDERFMVLDNPEFRANLIRFENEDRARVVLRANDMHCSSCIWLLEHLPRFHSGILSAEVNFPRREVTIDFVPDKIKLSGIAGLMSSVGYAPSINLADVSVKEKKRIDNRVIKIGVAGFCFANIMLLSFPEYFGAGDLQGQENLLRFFSWLSLALSLPVLIYSGNQFFVSAWKSIKNRTLNIDAPIALAIAVTFGRSIYEIIVAGEAGYLDSMTGIIFFMLIGRYFQDRTYERMNFERDYKSYFPISVIVKNGDREVPTAVTELKKGDTIFVHSQEIVPTDSVLLDRSSYVDYSFVTGESEPVRKVKGDRIYAGARQTGAAALYEVLQPVSSGYLTQLWNNDVVSKRALDTRKTYIDSINKYFSSFVIGSAVISALVWLFIDAGQSLNALTSVLIVACPCTLLLASTFANGSVLRWLSKKGLYLKSAEALDRLSRPDVIVFDKTGTITGDHSTIVYEGDTLDNELLDKVITIARQSGHPLSRVLASAYPDFGQRLKADHVSEKVGKGISGDVAGEHIALGSSAFVGDSGASVSGSSIWVAVNGSVLGKFVIKNRLRDNIGQVIQSLKRRLRVQLLSGDHDTERNSLEPLFGNEMFFERTPHEKLEHIDSLQSSGKKVIMIGDGLNDAGALMAAEGGIAVSDNTNNYFPACDAILDAKSLSMLPRLLSYISATQKIVYAAFVISVLYNFVGVYFSVTAQLSPLIAAILMPASSISVVVLTTLSARILAWFRLGS